MTPIPRSPSAERALSEHATRHVHRSRPWRPALATVAGVALLLPLIAPPAVGAEGDADVPPTIVDDFEAPLAGGTAGSVPLGFSQATSPNSTWAFSRSTTPPAPVPGAPDGNAVLQNDVDVDAWGVVIRTFADPTVTEWVSQDWSASEGLQLQVHGRGDGTSLFVDVFDNRTPGSTGDDAERWTASFTDDVAGWRTVQLPFAEMTRKEVGNGAPNDGFQLTEVWGWAFGTLDTDGPASYYLDDVALYGVAPERPLTVGFSTSNTTVTEGSTAAVELRLSKPSDEPVTVDWATTTGTARPDRDYAVSSGTVTFEPNQTRASLEVATVDDDAYTGERGVVLELSDPQGAAMGRPPLTRLLILDDEQYDPALIEDFEMGADLWTADRPATLEALEVAAGDPRAVPGQDAYETVGAVSRPGNGWATVRRPFSQPQDWSSSSGLDLMFHGTGSGKAVTVGVENAVERPRDADPARWRLAWSDEFNARRGTPADPENWTHEIGDGTIIGKPGWGNDELQYYTDRPENVSHDGKGNLVLTVREEDPETAPQCYYGPCRFTSARLVTQHKQEFTHGRIEARVQVPRGSGLWPAVWSLGTDINRNPWPASGEIDIMENVGREPNTVFGTIHGPGYEGGQSFGGTYEFDRPVADRFHEFAVEWTPEKIVWSVDDIVFHEAQPSDVAPDPWVFEKPFFLLMNVAVGGNFGGQVGDDAVFPQKMTVDWIRVYQADPAPERFTATFKDDVAGWRTVHLPFSSFQGDRRAELDLTDVRALTVRAMGHRRGTVLLDEIRLACGNALTVTSAADAGPGSLRQALGSVCAGGTVSLAPELAGATVPLTSELTVAKDVTVDATQAPGATLSGQGAVRPLVVTAGAIVTVRGLTVQDGYGWELAGGVLNNGHLTLEGVTVAQNRVATSGNDFWKGGGGVYTGENATLVLRDSTVRDNVVEGGPGGGLYGFFGSTVTVERSTVSGNTATDVGGGIRSLGDLTLATSTLSGNTATGWHGGGAFQTDGTMTVTSSTITGNTSPGGTAGGLFVGTFGPSEAHLTLRSSIVAANSGEQCFLAPFGAGAVSLTSLGHNVVGDTTCGAAAEGDRVVADAGLAPLAANGGPTWTHALLDGSPAIGAGAPDSGAVDQRGAPRDGAPDAGAYEVV